MAEVITMPKLGFDMAEGTLINWVKAEGDQVEKGELLAEIETDKATVEVESMYSGTIRKLLVSKGAIVPVNEPIAVVGEKDEEIDFDALVGAQAAESPAEEPASQQTEPEPAKAAAPAAASPPVTSDNGNLPDGVKASPLARRMAEEESIDIRQVKGSGPDGRIVKKDVEDFLASPPATSKAPASPGFAPLTAAQLGEIPADQEIPLSRLRQAIGRRMTQAKQEFPHFYVTTEYEMGPLMEARRQVNLFLKESGEKLSVNDFIIKAAALTLRQFPNLNASLGDDSVVQHGHVNIGVAVAVENGLLTVVCQDADRKPLRQISQEVKEKAERARLGRIQPSDVEGSTFSISNLGMFDVDHFIAIINPPEAAILAIGSAAQVPVVVDGELTVGWRMKATISVDHRVSDGAEAAQFMQALAQYIENPTGMMV